MRAGSPRNRIEMKPDLKDKPKEWRKSALLAAPGRGRLLFIFIFIITPIAWLFRLMGKDPLQLKPRPKADTFWRPAKDNTPLDKLF